MRLWVEFPRGEKHGLSGTSLELDGIPRIGEKIKWGRDEVYQIIEITWNAASGIPTLKVKQ